MQRGLFILLGLALFFLPLFPIRITAAQGNLGDDIFTINCDTGEQIIGGTRFTFVNINPGFSYRVTAIGINGFDPVLAVVTAPGEGRCNDDARAATGSQVAVPGVGLVEATGLAAQVQVSTNRVGDVDVVVGGFAGASGQFAMVIEGLAINPASELDGFLISVPEVVQSDPIGVYMVRRSGGGLDPYLSFYGGAGLQQSPVNFNDTQLLFACDDAGVGNCSDTPAFPGGGVDIANGGRYEAANRDAGLVITPNSTERYLFAFGSYNGASTGDYAIIVVGNAPGNLTAGGTSTTPRSTGRNPGVDCENIAVSVLDVSSEYSTQYAAENLLDDNENTSWSSSGISGTQYVVVSLGSMQTVDTIYFNSYAATEGFEADSIQEFDIAVLDGTEPITVASARANDFDGYQRYTFDPVRTDNITLIFRSNYGGENYEASDLLVCGG